MIAIFTLIFVTAAFLILCLSFFVKKDENVSSAMLGDLTQFHFIPILCVSALFIIGESTDTDKNDFNKAQYVFSIIFSAIALLSLIFIASKTNLESPSYANWIIKHCAYGSLIALLIHHICFAITGLGTHIKEDDRKDTKDWEKGCYIAFSLIVALCSFAVSFFLKEIIIPFINLLIYIGMTVQFFKINKDSRKDYYSEAPGAFNIIMMIFSLGMVGFLGMKMRTPQ